MKRNEILKAFKQLNALLKAEGSNAEVCIVGGAVMCLVFNARDQTKDVDAIFHPKTKVYDLAKKVAQKQKLPPDWLNDSAKVYITEKMEPVEVLNMSHLKIFAPSAKYMLAMKCLASRVGTKDESDIEFLIKYLRLTTAQEVMSILTSFYDLKFIQPKTQYLIEEIIEMQKPTS